ncbi:unnamed protein product [Mytilus coruscus]|uniref:LRAT domain-containing protein n=1 Tax=Mytilus coruscus TaxID=42192 RepID=A0A6J8BNX3_MYTCO|nr:unnamed protein product [Mytilus coruscus]
MEDNDKSEDISVEHYRNIDTSERENKSGDATEDLDQTSDSAANTCHETITNQVDLGEEHTHLVKYLVDETHDDDSVNQSHVKVYVCNKNDKSETEIFTENGNQQERTRESNDATNIENQPNDNAFCQETVTYKKSQMEDNIETGKSQMEDNVNTEKSLMEDKIKTEKSQMEDNIETGKSQMEDNVNTEKSLMEDKIKTEKSQMEDNIETEKSQMEDNINTEKSLIEDKIKTEKSQMVDNIETEKSQMEVNIETEKSQMENNIKTDKFQMDDNIETEKSQMEDNIETEKSQTVDNIETEKSPDKLYVVNPVTECSLSEDYMFMQRAPSHITVAKWTKKNTPERRMKSSHSVIKEEVDALTRHNSKKRLINNSGINDNAGEGIGIESTKVCMNITTTSESMHKEGKNDYRLATNNDEGIKSKRDRLSGGVPDDDTDSNNLHTSLQSIKHEESETVRSCMDCIKPIQVKTWKEILRGDHIILSRSFYDHHAIVVRVIEPEDDNSDKIDLELIHQTNSPMGAVWDKIRPKGTLAKLQRKIETVNLKTDIVMICKYWGSIKPSTPEEVVKRSIGALQVDQEEFRYDIIDNNCEHFASWCVTGTRLSVQIRKVRIVLKIFFKLRKGFRGLSDELLRNQVEYEHGMLCKMCFERNKKMLSVTKMKVLQKDDIQKGDIILYSYFRLLHCSVVLDVLSRKEKYIKCEIAHYAFKGPFTQKKIQSDILKVPFNGSVSVFDYSSEFKTYDPEEVVCRARERIGEQMFSYFSNDSSHFARWCKLKLLN